MGHPFKKNFFLETVDIRGALYVYTLGGVFALSLGVVLFCSTKFRQKLKYMKIIIAKHTFYI